MTHALTLSHAMPMPSAVGNLDAYIHAAHRYPMLSAEEEFALGRRLRICGLGHQALSFGALHFDSRSFANARRPIFRMPSGANNMIRIRMPPNTASSKAPK